MSHRISLPRGAAAWLGAVALHWVMAPVSPVWAVETRAGTEEAPRSESSAPPQAPSAAVQSQNIAKRLMEPDCKGMHLPSSSLVTLQRMLWPQGVDIVVLGCPLAPAPLHQVLAVAAIVRDGDKAQTMVRGALADGEWVDMGGGYRPRPWPAQGQSAALDDADVSPDVQFNRRWLRSVMASQGYASVNGPWWAFIPTPAAAARSKP